jgi:hypothetical protein
VKDSCSVDPFCDLRDGRAGAGLGQSANIIAIAMATILSRQTVYRIKGDPAAAEAALATWGGRIPLALLS